MHEARLMNDLMRRVLELAANEKAQRVTRVSVWLGALSHMSSFHFAEHFVSASRGTIAEGAELDAMESTDIHDRNAESVLIQSVDVET
jgi:hydrogenase nickel incorporation protein HypA/HybF